MLKAIRNLDYTVIICQDIESMKRFYGDILGFPLYRDFGDWVEFSVGANLLTLRRRGTGYDDVKDEDGAAPPAGAASLQLAFRVTPSQVDSCYLELQQKRATIMQPPSNREGTNHRTLFFKDPEGNILEIYADL
jgi:catechol 2,3-dioxygenase-like lactoylglutathione lyase family enzyme